MNAANQRAGKADLGFTLLELVGVLAILALAAAIAAPRAQRSSDGQAARAAVTVITSAIKVARAQAMRNNIVTRVTVDGPGRRVHIDSQARAIGLPKGVTVVWASGNATTSTTGSGEILFRPDGSSSGGSVVIKAFRQAAAVRVDWLTGRTEVKWRR